jgi:hypothetical protein
MCSKSGIWPNLEIRSCWNRKYVSWTWTPFRVNWGNHGADSGVTRQLIWLAGRWDLNAILFMAASGYCDVFSLPIPDLDMTAGRQKLKTPQNFDQRHDIYHFPKTQCLGWSKHWRVGLAFEQSAQGIARDIWHVKKLKGVDHRPDTCP